jgi:hypothetical protein
MLNWVAAGKQFGTLCAIADIFLGIFKYRLAVATCGKTGRQGSRKSAGLLVVSRHSEKGGALRFSL